MTQKYNLHEKYFPLNDIKALRKSTFTKSSRVTLKKWRIFTTNLTKTPYMVECLDGLQKNICPICLKNITKNNGVIHHLDYNHQCIYSETETIASENSEHKIAKCSQCSNIQDCIDKVVYLHKSCHMVLHIKEGRISKTAKNTYSKDYWINKTSVSTLEIIDEIMLIINKHSGTPHTLRFSKSYIGIEAGNFIYFIPKGDHVHIYFDSDNKTEMLNSLKSLNLNAGFSGKRKLLGVDINNSQLSKNKQIIELLITEALNIYNG